jgi:hypothetical protein
VWWKRLPPRLFADISIVGLLPAFSIGRIGCTVVSDHIGAAVDPDKWYSFLAMDYPRSLNLARLAEHYPGTSEYIRAWNLGLVEFLYLVPVNIVVLWLAFRHVKRPNAGFITVLTGILYAPVRFGLDFLRPEETDPRYLGLTFAQWASIVALGAAVYVAMRVLKNGSPAEVVAPTSGEAQARLKSILKETAEDENLDVPDAVKPGVKVGHPKRAKGDAKVPKATAKGKQGGDEDEEEDDEADEKEEEAEDKAKSS